MTTINELGRKRFAETNLLDVRKSEDMDYLRDHFPAIASNHAVGMSDEYQFMPTFKMAEMLAQDFNMKIAEVGQQWSRRRNPAGQEHFIKFRMPSDSGIQLKSVGDSIPELVIMNSHNGRSTIRAYAGIFRLVCSNGMVVADRSFGALKLRHFGEKNSYSNFSQLLAALAKGMSVLDGRLTAMRDQMMTPHQQNQLAKHLMALRGVPDWLEAKDVLEARRVDDEREENGNRSVWTTFNVLQENLTNASIHGVIEGRRNASIRPLTGARAHILQNEKIWDGLELFIEEHYPTIAALNSERKAAIIKPQVEDAETVPEPIAEEPVNGQAEEDATDNRADAQPEEHAPAPKLERSFEDLMNLVTYQEMAEVASEELQGLDAQQRTKFVKRKSYLKGKQAVDA